MDKIELMAELQRIERMFGPKPVPKVTSEQLEETKKALKELEKEFGVKK